MRDDNRIAKGVTENDFYTIDNEYEYRYVDYEDGIKLVGYSGSKGIC